MNFRKTLRRLRHAIELERKIARNEIASKYFSRKYTLTSGSDGIKFKRLSDHHCRQIGLYNNQIDRITRSSVFIDCVLTFFAMRRGIVYAIVFALAVISAGFLVFKFFDLLSYISS